MCNDYRLLVDLASVMEDFADLKIKIRFSEGRPNFEAREDIKITNLAPIVKSVPDMRGEGDLVSRRWSWPGSNKNPAVRRSPTFVVRSLILLTCLPLRNQIRPMTS